MAKILAVCRSEAKGVSKAPVPKGVLREDYGLVGDAHADPLGRRQVSLLATESIDKMRALGLTLSPGDFAENLTCEGINLPSLPVGTRLRVGGQAILEITQIGKECHQGCAIMRQVGKCIMPREGVFARVVRGGAVAAGDIIEVAKTEPG
jgi:MOSC domain-containing protein YiiM